MNIYDMTAAQVWAAWKAQELTAGQLEKWQIYHDIFITTDEHGVTYQIVHGTAYHIQTPAAVIRVLESSRRFNSRIRVFYGDIETGRDWCEEYDTIGTIGRSMGKIKIPLLIKNSRSMGGEAILDHCIIKITEAAGGRVLYQSKNYTAPAVGITDQGEKAVIRFACVDADNITRACFETREKAEKYCDFINGKRNTK